MKDVKKKCQAEKGQRVTALASEINLLNINLSLKVVDKMLRRENT